MLISNRFLKIRGQMKKQKVRETLMKLFINPFSCVDLDWFIKQCKEAKKEGAKKVFILRNNFRIHFTGYRLALV